MKPSSGSRFSTLAAWAVAFGTAVGWGSFVMPGTSFLPKAGPLGTVLGLVAGGAIMSVIAWNYRFMIGRMPGPGGAFSYAKRAFGDDHGFLCAWFLCLTYVAIVWANATALAIVFHCALGDVFRFGYLYSLGGYDVYLGEMLLSGVALAAACAICLRRGLSSTVQTILAVAFAAGIAACFVAVAFRHSGGLQAMAPAFSPVGDMPVSQVLKIVALAPWLFVGFESISHLSGEFSFPRRRSFGVMAAALATSVAAYALLSVLPAMAPLDGGWSAGVFGSADLHNDLSVSTFATVERALGRVGVVAISLTMIGAVFTNLVGNMVVVSRLVAAMSDEGMLPRWAGIRSADGTPCRAILVIAGVSLVTAFLGRTAIGFIVDVATIGAAIAYAYTSAAAFRTARGPGGRLARATGACGLVLSVALCILFIMPNYLSGKMMATESYLLIVVWCILGFLFYRSLFLRDQRNRFGRSTVGSKLARNGGTGLGLAICGQLAAAMGGRLDVKSDLGIGSTFSVVVPRVRPAADRGESAAPASEPAPAPRVDAASSPRRILAVDDSRLNLMVLKALLKGIGDFEVVSAGDGQEALKILESPSEGPFDLVLTDMWMPNLDGEGLAKAIRSNPALASLRVVVVTADVEFREKAAELGFDGTLLKPITGEKLSRLLAGEPARR